MRDARADFLQAVDGLSDSQMLQAGAVGYWSVKDTLAHLTAWEAELVTALSRNLRTAAQHAPELTKIDDLDEWNEEQYHLNARRALAVILEDFHGVHKYLLRAIEDLDAKTLEEPMRFEWMEGDPLAYLVLETAVWHEQEHAQDIRRWREAGESE